MKKSFSKKAALSYGFGESKKHLGFFIPLLLLLFLVQILPGILQNLFDPSKNGASILSFVISILGWILELIVAMGVIKIALEIHDNKRKKFSDLFYGAHLLLKYIASSFLYGLIVVVGLILLIIPGIVWAIKFQYFSYFIVDKELGPIEALKSSAKITNGVKWNLFFLRLFIGGINILGAIAFIVGLFITIPLGMMAEVYVYRKLGEKKSSTESVAKKAGKKVALKKK
ncbi:MAG: hypothetical protein COX79_01575 [Candidatus Levybacteria bacterium CG_4_10_14_0_2_um_filter_36_16]|nr:MAG: hypothetical protein AUK12_03135 [Candidatus Levybacteria bacterium CG2_30_37_29]PIR79018.1 MAG: hypothetical protein COU26_03385 [Candidatus Levybacteria bacterium CG10_big_fil_rev_8_21_14_0_10_36_30]PIZ97649.1 MAG: hypothetical protein COX79_01575 [Candidatus Levybacteria bacterium CG_4_10_14_0_2_um_filter_36_16]